MPIIDVLLVRSPGASPAPGLAQAVADAAAAELGAAPGRVWVRLHHLDAADYAEDRSVVSPSELPAFVTLLQAHPPAADARAAEAARLTAAIAAALGRPADRVHLEYAPAGAGRMAFGGRLLA